MIQLDHQRTGFVQKKFPLVLILDGIQTPANIGGLFRLAEAFGVEKMIACETIVNLQSPRLRKTARSTISRVDFEDDRDCVEVCGQYLDKGYKLIALEITQQSRELSSLNLSNPAGVALVIGHERSGIQHEVLQLCGEHVHIDMYGLNSSMNVAQATAIALYEITKKLPPIE